MARFTQFKAIWGYFEPFRSPPMAISERKNGSKPPARVSPALIQPWSTLIQPFGVPRAAYGPIYPIYGNLGLFWALPEPPDGNFRKEKWFQTIGLGVPCLDPTLIHLDPAIWGLQGRPWPKLANLWQFGAIFGHKYCPKCRESVGAHWITILHHQTDQKNAKVVLKK